MKLQSGLINIYLYSVFRGQRLTYIELFKVFNDKMTLYFLGEIPLYLELFQTKLLMQNDIDKCQISSINLLS